MRKYWYSLTIALLTALSLAVISVAKAAPIHNVACGSSQCIDGSNFPQCTGWNGVPVGTFYQPGDGSTWVCTFASGWVLIHP